MSKQKITLTFMDLITVIGTNWCDKDLPAFQRTMLQFMTGVKVEWYNYPRAGELVIDSLLEQFSWLSAVCLELNRKANELCEEGCHKKNANDCPLYAAITKLVEAFGDSFEVSPMEKGAFVQTNMWDDLARTLLHIESSVFDEPDSVRLHPPSDDIIGQN